MTNRPKAIGTAGDLAELTTTFQSLERREVTTEEVFPQAVTVNQLTGEVSE